MVAANKGALSGRRAGASHKFRDRIAFPDPQQKHLAAIGVFEDVIDAIRPGDFKEARAARIGTRRCAGGEEHAQFGEFLFCMVPQIFQNGRLF